MAGFRTAAAERVRRWRMRAAEYGRTRCARRIGATLAALLVVYGVAGALGVPALLRHILTTQVASALKRTVAVGRIRFNPYRLRLEISNLHIADRDGGSPFVDVRHIHVKASWASLFRMAAVVAEVTVDRPRIRIVRTAPQTFNFSDLLAPAPEAAVAKPAAPSKPLRFALSNIRVRDGDIRFDDRVTGSTHEVASIQIGVPFIASLPRDVDIYVQPLIAMVVDGSPLRIVGQTKPLSATRDTVLTLDLHALDLHHYLGYLPVKLPVKLPLQVPHGNFSCFLQIHFVSKEPAPVIAIAGRMSLADLQVNDSAGPIVALNHLLMTLNDIEPLNRIYKIGQIRFDGLAPNLVLNPDGTTNLTALTAGAGQKKTAPLPAAASASQPALAPSAAQAGAGPAAPPASVVAARSAASAAASSAGTPPAGIVAAQSTPSAAAAPSPAAPMPQSPPEVTLDSFRIEDSSVRITSNSGRAPAQLQLGKLHVLLRNFSLNGHWSAPFEVSAALASGGQLAFKGGIDLADHRANTDVAIDQLDLPALQGFARDAVAAKLAGGKLDLKAAAKASFAPGALGLHVEPASLVLSDFALAAPDGREEPLQWRKFSVQVAQADLASRTAAVSEVRADGVKLLVRRERDGDLSLLTMLKPPTAQAALAPPQTRAPSREAKPAEYPLRRGQARGASDDTRAAQPAGPKPAPWTFSVASVVLDGAEVRATDEAAAHPVSVEVAPLNLRLKDVSSDFTKPIGVEIDGAIGRHGTFKAAGSAAISPLRAKIKIAMRHVDLSPADAYLTGNLNAKIASALLTMGGVVRAEQTRGGIRGGYQGDVALGNLRVLDRLTNQDFLRWQSFSLRRIDASGGAGKPKAHIGEIALRNFDAGIILTADGKLNLKDITSRPGEAPAPAPAPAAAATLQAQPAPAATPAQSAQSGASAPPAPAVKPAPIAADVAIGAITLSGGNVDYSDYFIKPNYSANLTRIGGKIGAFGTASTQPAEVDLHGQINGSAPLSITGAVNPLAPMAFVDLTLKADGVELIGFSPYTTKYTGYPIENGALTADVHYHLDQGALKAENHIVIDQLTFGDKVENSTAINLPIRLAVAILKDSKGVIDLNVPISGSLSDPQFSIGSIVLHAFWNIIVKAATSPFSLLGAAFGSKEDLSQVTFAPGYALLTPAADQKLDTVAKALQQRTGLKLDVQGCIDPAVDREGLRHALIDLAVREQKLKASGGSSDPWDVKVTPDEYDKYLYRAYKAADFSKPRDFIGMAKSLPPAEMKKLMLANVKVTDADLGKLADARADAVRKYLAAKIDPSRISVKPPNLDAGASKNGGAGTRALLTLQ